MPSSEDEDTDVLRGRVTEQGDPGQSRRAQEFQAPVLPLKLDGLLCLFVWPSLQLGWQVLSGQRAHPLRWPKAAGGPPVEPGRQEVLDPHSSHSCWASVTLREAPFPEPTPHLLLSRAPPPRHLVDKYFPRERTPGVPDERESPEDFGLESEIMGLGSSCVL